MLILSYHGASKTGKTTFGFTAPKPLAHLDFDLGRERAIWRFKPEEQQQIISYPLAEPPKWNIGSGDATRLWANFERYYEQCLNSPYFKTIFIDTGTQMWKANHQEYLENYIQKTSRKPRTTLLQIEYRTPNDRMRAKLLAARQSGKLLIVSHYEADEYEERWVTDADGSPKKESIKTGRKTHSGFGEMTNLTDLHLYTYLKQKQVNGRTLYIPAMVVLTCGIAPPSIIGAELEEPTWNKLMELIERSRSL